MLTQLTLRELGCSFSLAVTWGLAVTPAEPGAALEHWMKTEGQILKEGSELLVKPPLADGW